MPTSIFETANELPTIITLSQYTSAITRAVAASPTLNGVWITAELSDVRVAGGHCYMELIEKNDEGQTIAKLRANIWRNNFIQLRQKFYSATQRDISTGIKALIKGSATHHSLYGLSFNIIDIDPSYTIGDMERLRREIILKLTKNGVANLNKSLTLPFAPQRIAVISAEGAAGFGDFINQLSTNSEGFVFYPYLFPCIMQGDRVSESIRNALTMIEATADLWDCIAIVRGGGATTDLNGFDDYDLAYAVATCGLPVIVGIGHERDRNVLDEIAHTSLKTPTAVAGFFIDRLRNAFDSVMSLADKIRFYATELLRGEERQLSTINGLIPQLAIRRIEDAKNRLFALTEKLPILTKGNINQENIKLDSFKNSIFNFSKTIINKENLRVDNYINFIKNLTQNQFLKAFQKTDNIESLIKVLDPKNTLKRGYSITKINGKTIKSISEVSNESTITTLLYDGEIKSTISS